MKQKTKQNIIIASLFVGIVALDQILKAVFTGKNFVLIKGLLSISYQENTGAAWSIFDGKATILAIVTILFLLALVTFDHFFKGKNTLYAVSFGLILGGAVGNLWDRLVNTNSQGLHFVKDFIKLDFINFPIFNIADMALTAGVICFAVFFLFFYAKEEKTNGNN